MLERKMTLAFIVHSPASYASHEEPKTDDASLARRRRRKTSASDLLVLENAFANNPHPSRVERDLIASSLSMDSRAVQIWFQNKRQASRRRKLFPSSSSPTRKIEFYDIYGDITNDGEKNDKNDYKNTNKETGNNKKGSNVADNYNVTKNIDNANIGKNNEIDNENEYKTSNNNCNINTNTNTNNNTNTNTNANTNINTNINCNTNTSFDLNIDKSTIDDSDDTASINSTICSSPPQAFITDTSFNLNIDSDLNNFSLINDYSTPLNKTSKVNIYQDQLNNSFDSNFSNISDSPLRDVTNSSNLCKGLNTNSPIRRSKKRSNSFSNICSHYKSKKNLIYEVSKKNKENIDNLLPNIIKTTPPSSPLNFRWFNDNKKASPKRDTDVATNNKDHIKINAAELNQSIEDNKLNTNESNCTDSNKNSSNSLKTEMQCVLSLLNLRHSK